MPVPAAVASAAIRTGHLRLLESEASETSNNDSAENPGTWHREKGESMES